MNRELTCSLDSDEALQHSSTASTYVFSNARFSQKPERDFAEPSETSEFYPFVISTLEIHKLVCFGAEPENLRDDFIISVSSAHPDLLGNSCRADEAGPETG